MAQYLWFDSWSLPWSESFLNGTQPSETTVFDLKQLKATLMVVGSFWHLE
jgi:hypothetical protein